METGGWSEEDLSFDRKVTRIGCTINAVLWGVICGFLVWVTPKVLPVLARLVRLGQ